MSVVDVAALKLFAAITGSKEPRQAIVFTRDSKSAYVSNADVRVAKVDRATRQVLATLTAQAL